MSADLLSRRSFVASSAIAGAALFFFRGAAGSAAPMHFAVDYSPAEWRRRLGDQRFAILREAATERPFSSPLLKEHRTGTFVCAACAKSLFSSKTKFESGTGWPSFWQPLEHAVVTRPDHSLLMARTEVLCARCGGHLGHVFDDGPKPTGLRYCMNGLALGFRPA